MQSSKPTDNYVQFVCTRDVALFESVINGRRRVWEHPIRRAPELTAHRNAYVVPPHVTVAK